MREEPKGSRAETAAPRSLFSDVPIPSKDITSGVDTPSEVAETTKDAKQHEGARTQGTSDLGKEPSASDRAPLNTGARGNSGVGVADRETTAEPASSPSGASPGENEVVPPAQEATDTPNRSERGQRGAGREDGTNDADSPRSERSDVQSAAGSPGARAEIELPEFAIERLEGDGSIMERSAATNARNAHPVTGLWEQVGGPRDADFAPGGYQRSVLMLNPALKAVAVYRLFRGDIALVLGGELALDAEIPDRRAVSGALTIREDPSSTSKFRRTPLDLGGTPAVVVTPPMSDGPWTFDWRREGMELIVGDKRYTSISREAFEEIRRGGGDVASHADEADRIARRAPETTRQRVNETSFFGIRGGGKRICFIVDVSGSMGWGNKLDRLKQELTTTIQGLKPDAQFSVVFFDSNVHTISQMWLQSTTDRANALRVIATQGSGSGTDPTGAFQFAFQTLNPLPDCIYYMTDGQTHADVVGLLRSLNAGPNKTSVHAIAFGDQSLEAVMKQVAAENNGAYLFVP